MIFQWCEQCGRLWRCVSRFWYRKRGWLRGSSSTNCFVVLHSISLVSYRLTGQSKVTSTANCASYINSLGLSILFLTLVYASDVVALLRCSRYSLGIMASSRGAVIGRLLLQAFISGLSLFLTSLQWLTIKFNLTNLPAFKTFNHKIIDLDERLWKNGNDLAKFGFSLFHYLGLRLWGYVWFREYLRKR